MTRIGYEDCRPTLLFTPAPNSTTSTHLSSCERDKHQKNRVLSWDSTSNITTLKTGCEINSGDGLVHVTWRLSFAKEALPTRVIPVDQGHQPGKSDMYRTIAEGESEGNDEGIRIHRDKSCPFHPSSHPTSKEITLEDKLASTGGDEALLTLGEHGAVKVVSDGIISSSSGSVPASLDEGDITIKVDNDFPTTSAKMAFTAQRVKQSTDITSREMTEAGFAGTPPSPPENSSYPLQSTSASSCPFSAIFMQNHEMEESTKSTSSKVLQSLPQKPQCGIGLSGRQLERVFPFHFVIDSEMCIVQCGRKLADYLYFDFEENEPSVIHESMRAIEGDRDARRTIEKRKRVNTEEYIMGRHVSEVFQMIRPADIPWEWSALKGLRDKALLRSQGIGMDDTSGMDEEDYVDGKEMELEVELVFLKDGKGSTIAGCTRTKTCFLGNIVFSHDDEYELSSRSSSGKRARTEDDIPVQQWGERKDYVFFLLHPDIHNLEELKHRSLFLSDLPRHSAQCDVILMGEQLKQETHYGLSLDAAYKAAEREKKKVVSALNTKRVFVRYVSHEIRTPLNITLLGLQHLEGLLDIVISSNSSNQGDSSAMDMSVEVEENQTEKISPSKKELSPSILYLNDLDQTMHGTVSEIGQKDVSPSHAVVSEVFDTVEDVKASCRVAVDIVNDLLLFERLDNGIFYIAKSIVSLQEVLKRVVNLFAVQARSLDIKLCFVEPKVTKEDKDSSKVKGEDRIKVDISKFDQVLRNLVSNALKFTPSLKRSTNAESNATSTTNPSREESSKENHSQASVLVSYEIIYQDIDAVFDGKDSSPSVDDAKAVEVREGNGVDSKEKESASVQVNQEAAKRADDRCNGAEITRTNSSSSSNESGDSNTTINRDKTATCSSSSSKSAGKIIFVESFHDLPLPDELFSIQEEDCYIDRFVRIFVQDTGPGMTYEEQCRLFREVNPMAAAGSSHHRDESANMASTLSSLANRGIQGSGLGLWIASIIIRLHGGRLGVTSEGKGTGTTFVIDLPLLLPQADGSGNNKIQQLPIAQVPSSMKDTLVGQRLQAREDARARSIVTQAPPPSAGGVGVAFVASAPLRSSFLERGTSFSSVDETAATSSQEKVSPSKPPIPVTTTVQSRSIPSVAKIINESPAKGKSWKPTITAPSGKIENGMMKINPSSSISLSLASNERASLLTKLKKQRLLIVDDTPLNRKIFNKVLRNLFASINEAENGLEAVEMFHDAIEKGEPYHVIMMDFLMPVMDGLEATKRIRQQSTYPVVIVGVTGNGWEADIDLFIASGADHVLMKPLDVEKFLCVLSQAPWL